MDLIEKASVRMSHWIKHNEGHREEYEAFAQELESAGYKDGARFIREMISLVERSNECLGRALWSLERTERIVL